MTKSQNQAEQLSRQQATTPEQALKSIGEHLKQARLKSGLSLAEVANKLKLSEKKLANIEVGTLNISNLSYTRAVLRGYAKILHTNIDNHLLALAAPAQDPEPIQTAANPQAPNILITKTDGSTTLPWPTRKLLWVISIIGTISLVIYLIWAKIDQLRSVTSAPTQITDPSSGAINNIDTINSLLAQPDRAIDNIALNQLTNTPSITSTTTQPPSSVSATPSSTASSASPTTTAKDTPSTVDNSSEALVIKFTGTSWYEVRDEQGTLLASGTENAGTIKKIKADVPINLVLGNANETTVVFKDKTITVKPSANGVARLTLE